MIEIELLKQYLQKASFSNSMDLFSARECLAAIEKALAGQRCMPKRLSVADKQRIWAFQFSDTTRLTIARRKLIAYGAEVEKAVLTLNGYEL